MASNPILSKFKQALSSRPFMGEFSWKLWTFATWIPAVIFFNDHVGELTTIEGPSMYPYFNTNPNESLEKDLCWNRKWKPTEDLQRGMIVSFWSPFVPEHLCVKRVIALEGDTVYTRAPCPVPTVRVPRNHVWVEGDFAEKSGDSNYYGPIPLNLISGRVTHILRPWKKAGPIQWKEFRGKRRVIKGRREDAPGWS